LALISFCANDFEDLCEEDDSICEIEVYLRDVAKEK
jgi:hypothetical protein